MSYKVLAGKSVSLEDVQVMRNGIHPQSQDGQGLLNEIDDLQQGGTVLVGKEQSVLLEAFLHPISSDVRRNVHRTISMALPDHWD